MSYATEITARFMNAARAAGASGVLASAMAEIIQLLRARVAGNPYPKTLPKQFTSTAVTLSAASGQDTPFLTNDFKNDGKYPYVLKLIVPITTTGTSAWRLYIRDVETTEIFFGAPNPIRVTQLVDANRRPTGVGEVHHEISPNGGFEPVGRSVGTADVVELTLAGLWVIEGL